jgi:hypothetical protein
MRIGGLGAALALLRANALYWPAVAPAVRRRLARWVARAAAIPDPALRTLAEEKLRGERFNVEVAATLATLSPRACRTHAVEAIVALQAMYDYLDVLTEPPAARELLLDPPSDSRRLLAALGDAIALDVEPAGDYHREGAVTDGGYLRTLVSTVRDALARLPARSAIADIARQSAERCAEAQALGHAAAGSDNGELERWARREAAGTDLGWPEWLAGAQASVLCLHALIAAAADERTTRADAERIDALYLSIGALTMLDSLIDSEQDLASGTLAYTDLYDDREQMGERLAVVARNALGRAGALPNADHHTMTLAGVVAYYASAPAAGEPFARPVFVRVCRELRPLIVPTLAVMRGWRLAKSVRAHTGEDRRVLQLWSTDRERG